MKLSSYVKVWIFLTAIMVFEYWALDHHREWSGLHHLAMRYPHALANLSTAAGRPVSYVLGWVGSALIVLTNPYVLRKKWGVLKKYGGLPGWLNFHIFCGMFGPTCVVFHSGFKVRGLVGISFWSMIIVAVSGIVGRYIYIQVLRQERDSGQNSGEWLKKFETMAQKFKIQLNESNFEPVKSGALKFVGLPTEARASLVAFPGILFFSILGDLRLLFSQPQTVRGMPDASRELLARFAVAKRRMVLIGPFRTMLGYWHAFHVPFAVFMYLAAVIHIGSELMFRIAK